MSKITTYGLGGYDPSKPNNNIVEEVEVLDEPEVLDPAKEAAIAKLESLGLTVEDIRLILGGNQ